MGAQQKTISNAPGHPFSFLFSLLIFSGLLAGLLLQGCRTSPPARSQYTDSTGQAQQKQPPQREGMNIQAWPLVVSSHSTDGSCNIWATPFFHYTRHSNQTASFHIFNYIQGATYSIFIPFYYRVGEDDEKHTGIIPVYFDGPNYWVAAPILSGAFPAGGNATSTWVTPLFHITRSETDDYSFHIGPYFQGNDHKLLFPLAYEVKTEAGAYRGIVPFYFQGPGGWAAPPLLSASWENRMGGQSTWITPLYHSTTDSQGNTWAHCLTYFRSPDSHFIFPFAYFPAREEEEDFGIIPFYFQGRDYALVPPLFSGVWNHHDGGHSAWITPFYHRSVDGQGREWMHCFNYFQSPDFQFLFPFWYREGADDDVHSGLIPFYFSGPDYTFVPPLLSGSLKTRSGDTTWITPLYHKTKGRDGNEWFHIANYYQGPHTHILFPFFFHSDEPGNEHLWLVPLYFRDNNFNLLLPNIWWYGEPGARNVGVFPFYFQSENSVCMPAFMSGWWENHTGGKSLWITPFFHHSENEKGETSFHVFNYFQGTDYHCLFPLWYAFDTGENKGWGIGPFYYQDKDHACLPALLSGFWKREAGGHVTWVTPLFHHTKDEDGNNSFHLGNFFWGPDYYFLFPLAYLAGQPGERHAGIIPIFFMGPDASCLLPVYYADSERFLAPLLLSGSWKTRGDGRSTWVTPLFHYTSDGDGEMQSLHVGPYFQGRDYNVLFPLAYLSGKPGNRHGGIIPLYFQGPDYIFAPALMTGGWENEAGGTTTWATPLFHSSTDGDGALTSMHLFPWFHGEGYNVLFPLYWDFQLWESFLPPVYINSENEQGGHTKSFLWPLTEYRTGKRIDKSLSTQLKPFVYQSADSGYEFNFLWRLFHIRNEDQQTNVRVGPFWWSESRAREKHTEYQFLGGLFAKDCDYAKKTYSYRLLWFIPISGDNSM